MGASLLVFANKTDVGSCMSSDEIREVTNCPLFPTQVGVLKALGAAARCNQDAPVDNRTMQRHHRKESEGWVGMGRARCQRSPLPLLRVQLATREGKCGGEGKQHD